MKEKNKINIEDIIKLIEKFLNFKLSGKGFEEEYVKIWRKIRDEQIQFETKQQDILDSIFSDCDMHCDDPKLRDKDDLNENDLRRDISGKLKALKKISIK